MLDLRYFNGDIPSILEDEDISDVFVVFNTEKFMKDENQSVLETEEEHEMTEEELRKTFEAFGAVDSARVVTNRFNNKSKGFGFVVMPNRPEAEKAIAAMSEKEVMGRKMRVNEAQNTLKADA